jgi:heptosyltransferase-2
MILYIQTAFLGDLLLSVPTLLRLRQLYPDKKIHLLCRKNLGSLFLENKLVDQVFDQFSANKPHFFEIRRQFSHLKYDLIICPHESFRSTWISALIRGKTKVGFTNFYSRWVFDHHSARPLQHPEVLRQLSLLAPLDPETRTRLELLQENKAPFNSIPLWSSMTLASYKDPHHQAEWSKRFGLPQGKKIVCLAPGSVWPTKQWGLAKYKQLSKDLIQKKMEVVLLGSAAEVSLAQEIVRDCPQVHNYVGRTSLVQLAQLIALCDVLVSNDSGAMHMASLVGTPSVSIFGPTVLEFGYQPWNTSSVVLENKTLQCRPCSSHGGKTCPIGTHECMTSIEVATVYQALTKDFEV